MLHTLLVLSFLSQFELIGREITPMSGSISGRVIDSRLGTPVPMVQVETSPTTGIAVTGPDGKYSLQGLRFGKYIVIASKPGYLDRRVAVIVTSENTTVDVLLTPKRPQSTAEDGLISHYPFDGSILDLHGGNPDAILYNTLWVPDRFGRLNSAVHFNGFSSYARLGNTLDRAFTTPIAKFTISGWAKTEQYPSQRGGGSIVAKAAGGNYGPYQWSVCHDEDGRIKGFVASEPDASAYIERQSEIVPLGQWFHFALVFDGSLAGPERVRLYVDGIAGTISRQVGEVGVTTQPTNQEITMGATHHAGNPLSPDNFYQGTIDDIRFYDRALGPAEIQLIRSLNGQ